MKKLIALLLVLALLTGLNTGALAADQSYAGKTVIIYTGNVRGRLTIYPIIKANRDYYASKGAEVLVVDTGNFLQGTSPSDTTMGAAVYDLMNAVGYRVAAMGRAEFVYTGATTGYRYHGNFKRYYTQAMLQNGTAAITYKVNQDGSRTETLPARQGAKFQTVCSHLTALPQTDADGATYTPYAFSDYCVVTTQAGLSFCFIDDDQNNFLDQIQDGFLTWHSARPTYPRNVNFVVRLCSEPTQSSQPTADVMDLTIYPEKVGDMMGGVIVVDNFDKSVTAAPLNLEIKDETIQNMVDEIVNACDAPLGKVKVLLEGRDSVSRNAETNLGDLVTDALFWFAQRNMYGVDLSLPTVAIMNGGNLDNFIYEGDLTETALLRALPFSPLGIGVIQLTGRQLLEVLEAGSQVENCPGFVHVSGMSYTIDLDKPYDKGEAYGSFYKAASIRRVTIDEVNGQPFDLNGTYNVVADNYLMNGNDTFYTLREAREGGATYANNGTGVKLRTVVQRYVDKVLENKTIGITYEEPQGRITVKRTPRAWERFEDIPEDKYYAVPVDWALRNDVTGGTSPTTFSPKANCLREHVVTFLWKAMGMPEPNLNDNPFVDIPEDKYYTKPVLRAYQDGITGGLDATHFGPKRACTRAQIVVFLWAAVGKPEHATTVCPFVDVTEDKYFYHAVLWAAENGITGGTDPTHFSPSKICTRAEVVTFLYKTSLLPGVPFVTEE